MGRLGRTLTIEIQSLGDAFDDFTQAHKAAAGGQRVPWAPKETLGFTSLEVARRVLTPQRLALVRAIQTKRPSSVYGLAKLVKRELKSVQQDLAILEDVGLVTFRVSGPRGAKVPRVPYREVVLKIAL